MKSADTAGGWTNHYRRMRRWEERSLRELRSLPDTNFHDAIDMALAYFLWSHSLREWLINDQIVGAVALDAELAKHDIWKLCRDVANRTRHFDLTRNPTDKHWSAHREYDPFSVQIEGVERHTANFFFNGRKLSIGDAVRQSAAMWNDVLQTVTGKREP